MYVDESESEGEETNEMPTSEYQQKPKESSEFWNDKKLTAHIEFIKDFHNKMEVCVFTEPSEIAASKLLKLRKKAVKTSNYVQFVYKTPARVCVATNVYGLMISTVDNWKNRHAINDVADLTGRHRVSVLCATTKFWWHEPSKLLMDSLIDRVNTDMKCLSANEDFRSALDAFNLEYVLSARVRFMREKLQTNIKQMGKQQKPGVFGLKIYNSGGSFSEITAELGKINTSGVKSAKWNNLLPAKYNHAVLVIRIDGFKITRSGFSIDMVLENMAYEKIEMCKTPAKIVSRDMYTKHESSDEDEEPAPPAKKRRELDW